MNLFKLGVFSSSVLLLAACGSKIPGCKSPEAAKEVINFVAEQIISDGAKDEKAEELSKKLTVVDVKTIPQSGGSGGLRCGASVSISYPSDFAGKIQSIFTSPASMDALRDHLDIKYGAFYGPATFRKLSQLFTEGVNPAELRSLSPDQANSIANKTIQKNIDLALTVSNKLDVNYNISPVEGSADKNSYVVKSQINDIENYDQNVLLLKFLGNIQ
jgi:hypothetical protein